MDCKACKARFRADKLIEDWAKANGQEIEADGWTNEQLESFIEEKQIPCPTCGKHDFTGIRKFNMMFKTHQGVTEDASNEIYLRPETAQGIFVNFPNVARTTRRKLPFGVCQVGKSFRNEISPGNFIFLHPRVRTDGAGVLLHAGHGSGVVQLLAHLLPRVAQGPGHQGRAPAPARPQAGGAGALLQGDDGL